ncbi:membrane metallo-endopeptidase-like 1 [Elysia marginata]|uniref:Membrane metallo-endopeptidase-like 1 n=1 Tax=Elysia marginata TaxID=1093978 RepID=A0AAV4JB01_9GAST|nr:membrane metallo-endopeptidase-like 1 [Elysia marginata]
MDDIRPTDRPHQRWPKMFYKSCMDTAQIEKIGLQPFSDSSFAKEWPTLVGSGWKETTDFTVADLNMRYALVLISPLLRITSGTSKTSNRVYRIHVSGAGKLGLPSRTYSSPRNGTVLMAYERYLRDMAIELGAEPSMAAQDAKTVVDMEVELVKVSA